MTAKEQLAAVPLFAASLDEADLAALAFDVHARRFARGETIVGQGDLGSSMFVLVSGGAAVTLFAPGGPRRVATLKAGDVIGEMSLLTGAARSATVKATAPTEALEITKHAMAGLLARKQQLIERLASVVEQRRSELDGIQQGAIRTEAAGSPFRDLVARMTAFYSS